MGLMAWGTLGTAIFPIKLVPFVVLFCPGCSLGRFWAPLGTLLGSLI